MGKDKKKSQKVKPQLCKGFKDYTPEEQIAREAMLTKIREVYERHGFLPFRTASVELAETLLGSHYNQDSLKELFGFEGPEETDMSLRYEFTLSLARFVAGNPDLPLPFRGYQYGTVWRVDKPGPGRYREFMQCDMDIVGTSNLLADAEIIQTMVETLTHLGVKRFKVRFSSRRILNGLVEYAGIPAERGPEVMRVIDKLEKQGREAVLLELGPGRTDQSGDVIPGLHLEDGQIKEIDKFLSIAGEGDEDPLYEVEKLLGHIEESKAGIEDLRQILSLLHEMKVDPTRYGVDLTIVRGLGYYTGPVFETTLLDLPEYGSVFSGGRYDNLVDRFLNRSIPAVGTSIGVDRLLAALIELKAIELKQSTSRVLVTVMDRERLPDYLEILRELRKAGIPAEIFEGDTKNLTKQIKYGDKVGIPFAVIAGSEEFEAGTITVKNLEAGREKARVTDDREEWLKAEDIQETIPRAKLLEWVRNSQ
ncbi:MAG TPA: histidine--tRNA ligase [candidate division Zixibacteria bacterium]|nr:histidine--tRNA ligase [candidate division Zixibacteria bacterium]